jgi:hypothetical protein
MQPTPPNTATPTSNLAMLVDTDRIRSSVKRLFRNRIDEILGEVFQNGQRAGATNITITTTENSFTIQDDGHGLLNGVDGFHTLLKLADSHFDNATIEDQDPMGLGIVSLLTHDLITEVTFSSGLLELTIDTKRWWTEPEYYLVWYERLVTLDTPLTGLRIFALCSAELVGEIEKALTPKDSLSYSFRSTADPFEHASPAQGYDKLLTITLNGENVRTSLPAWTQLHDTLIRTTFQGSKLRIGYNSSSRKSSVLWYGQLIPIEGLSGFRHNFNFHLEVTSGRPVNPLSPSRTGIIQDAAYQELLTFVKDQLFRFVFNLKNRKKIRYQHIESCYLLDPERALIESPYILAEELEYNPNPESFEDFTRSPDILDQAKTSIDFFAYEEAPLLLNESIFVQLADSPQEHSYGLASFLPQIGKAFTLKQGDPSRLTISTLWWKPEGEPQHDFFHQPGSYAISPNNQPPTQWTPITQTPVFAFSDPSSYDISEVDLIVGTSDILSFLKNECWAVFAPHDDSDFAPQEESFRNTVEDFIRTVIGKCVRRDFTLYDLRPFFSDEFAPVISVTYHYRNKGRSINPKKSYRPKKKNNITAVPCEISAENAVGQKVRLQLY